MATSPTESVAHPRGAGRHPPGPPNYQRLAKVHDRLSLALDRAHCFGAFVDPRFLIELRDVGE